MQVLINGSDQNNNKRTNNTNAKHDEPKCIHGSSRKKEGASQCPSSKRNLNDTLTVLFVLSLLRSKPVEVNRYHSLLVIVPSDPSTGSPTLLRIISNVPISNTVIQIICTTIISQLKIRNGSISVRYPDFLKNGIFFNIIRSVGDISTLESELNYG